MTATRSERGLDDGEVAREFAGAEVLANALEYFRAGRYAEAEAAYAAILAHEVGHFICLHHLGLIAHARGEHAAVGLVGEVGDGPQRAGDVHRAVAGPLCVSEAGESRYDACLGDGDESLGGGALVTELVFNLPGIGQYEAQAIGQLDVPPILVGAVTSGLRKLADELATGLPEEPGSIDASRVIPLSARSS